MENVEIARIFADVADLLEIQGENPFRVRAYRSAARTIETLGVAAATLARTDPKALEKLPGIGKDLAGKVGTIVATGDLPLLRELSAALPPGLVQMIRIGGLGPKRARLIYDTLGVTTLDALEAACREGRLRTIRGLGPVLETRILAGIADYRLRTERFRLIEADAYVQPLLAHLRATPGVAALEVAGSYRRRCETVGDIDILAAARTGSAIAERFVGYAQVAQVLARGPTKCSVALRSGLQVDLRVVPAASFGAALHYFTGSKAHNITIRTLGVRQKLKINEYGVFRGSRRVGGRHEADVFKAVGLPWIPPVLREDRGEIDAARAGRLPDLVDVADLRGDLQMHTTYTDGRHTVAEMAEACRARGYAYMAVTDHSEALKFAGGLDRAGYRKQFKEIERVQKRLDGLTILKGAEVDILDDGRLDLDEATLRELDVVVVSVHSKLHMEPAEMTRRLVRAIRHPQAQILGHPTGRIIGRRNPSPFDMEAIVAAARDYGVALEINAQPDRLDLNDIHCQMAREAGVKMIVSTDAHRIEELACVRYGVDQARRGWCTRADILNTLPLDRLRQALKS